MSVLDSLAHGLIGVLATFVRLALEVLGAIEGVLRALMSGVGLSADVQTLLLILLLATFLFGVLRLLRGRLRTLAALTLFLVLAHTLGQIVQEPVS